MTLRKKVTGELPPPTPLALDSQGGKLLPQNPGRPVRSRNVWWAKQSQNILGMGPADKSDLAPGFVGRGSLLRGLRGARRDRDR
jgi:hypothetical protein